MEFEYIENVRKLYTSFTKKNNFGIFV